MSKNLGFYTVDIRAINTKFRPQNRKETYTAQFFFVVVNFFFLVLALNIVNNNFCGCVPQSVDDIDCLIF